MTFLRRQSLTAYQTPLCETIVDLPPPKGSEVIVRIERCGVCHSDLHMQDGFFALGDGKTLDVRAGRTLPFTLGHEIAGIVEATGPDADARVGNAVAVYPWIGCGVCDACTSGQENLCGKNRHLGISADGGFATHIVVPHPRYLIARGKVPAAFAGLLMCSGLTAYAALERLRAHDALRGPLLLVGMGGVGLMGLALARTMTDAPIVVAEPDAARRNAALAAGASEAVDPADPNARRTLLKATGGVRGAVDFVGSDTSLDFATALLTRGGRLAVTGLLGGKFSIPASFFALKAIAIDGILTGTLAQARSLMALAQDGRLAPPPLTERPMTNATAALDDLRAGRVTGRIVLTA